MSGTGTAERTTDEGHGLRRSLGFRDLVVYGLPFIAPMAPVEVFGTLDARPRGAVAPVRPVLTAAMAFTRIQLGAEGAGGPRAGSVSAYTRVGLGRGPGSSPAGRRGRTVGWAGLSVVAVTLGAWL